MRESSYTCAFFYARTVCAFVLVTIAIGLIAGGLSGTANASAKVNRPTTIARISSQTASPSGNTGPGWSVVTAPSTGSDELFGATCVSDKDCWAVGYSWPSGGAAQTLAEHWNGTSWSIVASPNMGTAQGSNSLNAVTCLSASDCWAVGNYGSVAVWQTLIEHWDGNTWSIVLSPNANLGADNRLWGVSCPSSNDCWAVGYYGTGSGVINQTLILHWNGVLWTIANSVNTSPSVSNDLGDVTCTSASNCWAVGGFHNPNYQTLIQHWDGTAWSIVSSPNLNSAHDDVLSGVACDASANCHAVGLDDDGEGVNALALRWDGVSWQLSATPSTGRFDHVACAPGGDCWAVGFGFGWDPVFGGGERTISAKWNGVSWSAVQSVNAQKPNTFANNVACSSNSQCWMVGSSFFNSGPRQAFIAEYSPTIPPLISVGSRMTHGAAGTFDVDLPLTGARGVECRSANGNYSIVFTFVNDVTDCGTAASGTVAPGPNSNQCTENLTGVSNANYINVELDNVVDFQNNVGNVAAQMGVLIGDTTGSGVVNSSDISQTQAQSGQLLTINNFRADVTLNGVINSSDISFVQSKSGTALPTSP